MWWLLAGHSRGLQTVDWKISGFQEGVQQKGSQGIHSQVWCFPAQWLASPLPIPAWYTYVALQSQTLRKHKGGLRSRLDRGKPLATLGLPLIVFFLHPEATVAGTYSLNQGPLFCRNVWEATTMRACLSCSWEPTTTPKNLGRSFSSTPQLSLSLELCGCLDPNKLIAGSTELLPFPYSPQNHHIHVSHCLHLLDGDFFNKLNKLPLNFSLKDSWAIVSIGLLFG